MPISDLKRENRAALHAELAEPCFHLDRTGERRPSEADALGGLALSVRFKSKLRAASAQDDGLTILENVESLIFHSTQLDAMGLELDHGDVIEVPGYDIAFRLDQQMDGDGPLNVYWTVTRA